jgi:hypothetical protein
LLNSTPFNNFKKAPFQTKKYTKHTICPVHF